MTRLDDMRLAAALAAAPSFTAAARSLGMPKQTMARRIARLEEQLGVRLVERTTRLFRLTAPGRSYADRCAEIVRLADDANREIRGEAMEVAGTLRVTADPLFGELFLPALLSEFTRRHPAARLDAVLTSRTVDLLEEGFDVAFRIGRLGDSSLIATRVADARLAFVAAPSYLRRRGRPRAPEQLEEHDCIALAPEGQPPRWAFSEGDQIRWLPVSPRLRVNHLGLALSAAVAGLGIANVPLFACAELIRQRALAPVLREHAAPFGGIFVVHASRRFVPPRVRRFLELATEHLRREPALHMQ